MPRLYRKRKKHGLSPGTLPVRSDENQIKSVITIIDYDAKHWQEKVLAEAEESFPFKNTDTVSWINLDGRNIETIRKIDSHFGIHPLALEDIFNSGQRPKIENYGDYLFLVLKMIHVDRAKGDLFSEQISLVLGKNFVISFQEEIAGDIFDPLRQRIRDEKNKIRQMGADYLVYSMIDAIVDHYFMILEEIGEKIDQLEISVFEKFDKNLVKDIHRLKTQVIYLRKQIWPLRDVIADLMRRESLWMSDATKVYLRDVYDHTVNVNETIEAFRDALSSLHDIYLSSISNKMNETMQFLTVFTAIFIPLTFIVGIYGMNFEYMPELKMRYGYFIVLGIMAFITLGLIIYFRRKRWI